MSKNNINKREKCNQTEFKVHINIYIKINLHVFFPKRFKKINGVINMYYVVRRLEESCLQQKSCFDDKRRKKR